MNSTNKPERPGAKPQPSLITIQHDPMQRLGNMRSVILDKRQINEEFIRGAGVGRQIFVDGTSGKTLRDVQPFDDAQ